MIDERYSLRGNTFVVELVVTEEVFLSEPLHRGVVHDAQKTRQDGFANFFGKRLSFRGIFLAMTFGAMAKNFMEKDGSGSASQKGRSNRRLVDGRDDKPFELLAHGRLGGKHSFVVGRVPRIHPIEIVVAIDVPTVRRFALDEQLEAVADLANLQLSAFTGNLQTVLRLGRKRHNGIDDRGG